MIVSTNYLSLTYEAKQLLVNKLQEMRDELMKESRRRRVAKPRKVRKRKVVFFSDAIEKLFLSMPQECQNFIKGE